MKAMENVVYVASAALVIIVLLFYAGMYVKIQRQQTQIARLETQILECAQDVKNAETAFEQQNAAIERMRVDTVIVIEKVKGVTQRYVETREVVIKELEKDTSYENRVKSIDFALRRFHGVRAESNNED